MRWIEILKSAGYLRVVKDGKKTHYFPFESHPPTRDQMASTHQGSNGPKTRDQRVLKQGSKVPRTNYKEVSTTNERRGAVLSAQPPAPKNPESDAKALAQFQADTAAMGLRNSPPP